jgi:hypothetical protein
MSEGVKKYARSHEFRPYAALLTVMRAVRLNGREADPGTTFLPP